MLADFPAAFLVFVMKHSRRWGLHIGCTKMFEHLFQAGMDVLNQFFCKIPMLYEWIRFRNQKLKQNSEKNSKKTRFFLQLFFILEMRSREVGRFPGWDAFSAFSARSQFIISILEEFMVGYFETKSIYTETNWISSPLACFITKMVIIFA